jgi:hypothetical protein
MNFVNIEYGRVYFAKYLISPLSNCRFISKHSIMMIRKAVSQIFNLNLIITSLSSSASLVEEGGKNFNRNNYMKFMTPQQQIVYNNNIEFLTPQQQLILQKQLNTIVISDRNELDEVYKMLHLLYGKEYKIVKYSPTLEAEENNVKKFLEFTVKLFSSCKMFITLSQSEESANIIFMNPTAIVIEARTMGSNAWHPSYFASAVGVNYYPSYSSYSSYSSSSSSSNRHRSKNSSVDINNVLTIVSSFLHSTSDIYNKSAEISSLQKENKKLKEQILNLLQQK